MDIVLSKDGVKCAVFKISDVQKIFFITWKYDYQPLSEVKRKTGLVKH